MKNCLSYRIYVWKLLTLEFSKHFLYQWIYTKLYDKHFFINGNCRKRIGSTRVAIITSLEKMALLREQETIEIKHSVFDSKIICIGISYNISWVQE